MSEPTSLTDYLLSKTKSDAYTLATRHPFLTDAQNRTLDIQLLAYWLSQDYVYASEVYPRFIKNLLIKISSLLDDKDIPLERKAQLDRIKRVFEFSLINIEQETKFFRDTAERYCLDLKGWEERKATRSYIAEMDRVSTSASLEEGLVFLWAMEYVYLDAWSFVATGFGNTTDGDERTKAAIDSFAKNWSSEAFVQFVNELRNIADQLGIERDGELWKRAEAVWDKVIELEIHFWPDAGEAGLRASHKLTS